LGAAFFTAFLTVFAMRFFFNVDVKLHDFLSDNTL
jgi:hypothetical protein